MKARTKGELDALFTRHPILRADGASDAEIDQASKALGILFPSDYRVFLRRYGGAVVGAYSIIGLRLATPMGDEERSVVEVTNRFRSQGWPGTSEWVVFSVDLAGNPIGFSADGSVWISDHDEGAIFKVADSFDAFLWRQCLKRRDEPS